MNFRERLRRWAGKPFRARSRAMNCQELVNLLVDYLDGTLEPETARELERHLEGCTSCLNFINTYKATTTWVRKVTYEEMPEKLKARLASFLRTKIREEKANRDRS